MDVSEKQEIIEKLSSDLGFLIPDALDRIKKHLKMLESFQETSDSCFNFIHESTLKYEISYKQIANITHLDESITCLKKMLHDMETNEKKIKNVLKYEDVFRKSGKNCPPEISSKTKFHKSEWENLKIKFASLYEEHVTLHKNWTEYFRSYEETNSWVLKTHEEISSLSLMYLNLEEMQITSKKVLEYKILLQNLNHMVSELENNDLLHNVCKTAIRDSQNHLDSSFGSLEKLVKCSEEILRNTIQETSSHKTDLEQAEEFLNSVEIEQLCDAIPLLKGDIKYHLQTVKDLLKEGAAHYASVQCIRRKLLLEVHEFALTKNTSVILKRLKDMLSRVSSYYLDLHDIYSRSNSLSENISLILDFISFFKRFLDKSPSSFPEIVSSYVELQIMRVSIQAHQAAIECLIQDVYKSYSPNDQLVYDFVEKLQTKWITIEKIYRTKIQETKLALCYWQNYLYSFNLLKIKSRKVSRFLQSHQRIMKLYDVQTNVLTVQKYLEEHEELFSLIQSMESAFKYIPLKNISERKRLEQDIDYIKKDLDFQRKSLINTFDLLKEMSERVDESNNHLDKVRKNISSVQLLMISPLPEKEDLLEIHCQEYKEALEKLTESSDHLVKIKSNAMKIQEVEYVLDFHEENFACQTLIKVLNSEVQEKLKYDLISLDKKRALNAMHENFTIMSDTITTLVKRECSETVGRISEHTMWTKITKKGQYQHLEEEVIRSFSDKEQEEKMKMFVGSHFLPVVAVLGGLRKTPFLPGFKKKDHEANSSTEHANALQDLTDGIPIREKSGRCEKVKMIEKTTRDKMTALFEQKHNYSTVKKTKLFEDILATLDEADNRFDSLEIVLSEPSIIGTATPQNFTRLVSACKACIEIIQHLNHLLFENSLQESIDEQLKREGMLSPTETLSIESDELLTGENYKKWTQFFMNLEGIEQCILDTLQNQPDSFTSEADTEEFLNLFQEHELLVSEIYHQKEMNININETRELFISSQNAEAFSVIKEKLKRVNEYWTKLCSLALEWQIRMLGEFFQSSELFNTNCEMELWLQESEERICSDLPFERKSNEFLQRQITELSALKQQLNSCSLRVKALLEISRKLISSRSFDIYAHNMDLIFDVQSKLSHILDHSYSLSQECSKQLNSLSEILMASETLQTSSDMSKAEEEQPTRFKRCCNFLMRVIKASIPIQAVLLLILGAAILLPKDEEELSCHLSKDVVKSLNPLLRGDHT